MIEHPTIEKPTICRMVVWNSHTGRTWPAVVTQGHDDWSADIFIFSVDTTRYAVKVPVDDEYCNGVTDERRPGTWAWPRREDDNALGVEFTPLSDFQLMMNKLGEFEQIELDPEDAAGHAG